MQNVNASSQRGGIRNDETLNRKQLSHLLRAATRIADDPNIIVIGSQAILGNFDAQNLPDEVTISVEADIAFRDDPDEAKADEVDGRIGELSSFHEEYGYYAQGVIITTAKLPSGWEDRVVSYNAVPPEYSILYSLLKIVKNFKTMEYSGWTGSFHVEWAAGITGIRNIRI